MNSDWSDDRYNTKIQNTCILAVSCMSMQLDIQHQEWNAALGGNSHLMSGITWLSVGCFTLSWTVDWEWLQQTMLKFCFSLGKTPWTYWSLEELWTHAALYVSVCWWMNAISDAWEDDSGVPAAAADEIHMELAEGKL